MSDFVVSALKYRPKKFSDVVGQEAVTKTLENAIATNKIPNAMIFCGPRGVGKTTCARIFANEINYLDKGFSKWISNSKAIFLILINEEAYHERYKMMDKENETNSTNWSVPYWYVDAGAAMMNCMLLIDETGLKSGFLGSHNMDIPNIKSLLDIPEEINILGFVTAGIEDSSKMVKKNKIYKKKLVHKEKYEK